MKKIYSYQTGKKHFFTVIHSNSKTNRDFTCPQYRSRQGRNKALNMFLKTVKGKYKLFRNTRPPKS